MRQERLIADDFLLLLRVSSRGLDLLHERSDVGFQHKRVLIEGLRELESSFGDRLGSGPERYLLRRLTPEEGAGGGGVHNPYLQTLDGPFLGWLAGW